MGGRLSVGRLYVVNNLRFLNYLSSGRVQLPPLLRALALQTLLPLQMLTRSICLRHHVMRERFESSNYVLLVETSCAVFNVLFELGTEEVTVGARVLNRVEISKELTEECGPRDKLSDIVNH